MKYNNMTDFEINKKVLKVVSDIKVLSYPHDGDGRSAGVVDVNDTYHWYDFCNSWKDAGTIISRHHIDIEWGYNKSVDLIGRVSASVICRETGKVYSFDVEDNPLRAVMIVFLMMMEGK